MPTRYVCVRLCVCVCSRLRVYEHDIVRETMARIGLVEIDHR